MSLAMFHELPGKQQCLVAMAVLLDGAEAINFLAIDRDFGPQMAKAATDLSALEPELRMPYLGALLREALRFLEGSGGKTLT